ncbi:MAG: hypothetical protein P4L57_14790 [Rhizomicrobium sp.]|nr:hypothetical protein [Rhizomicrobium sp.]
MKLLATACLVAMAITQARAEPPKDPTNFLFLDADDASDHRDLLARPDIAGGQIIYPWRLLEPKKDHYDFSKIERDLALAQRLHKKLWVTIGDRTFSLRWKGVPDYVLNDPVYAGGVVLQYSYPGTEPGSNKVANGTVTMQWLPTVRERFQKLLRALGARFDGRIYGIELGETSMEAGLEDHEKGFTCDGYFDAEMENIAVAREAFRNSTVVMDANFWPCEWNDNHHYMSRAFAFAATHDIGMGGPDIVPYKKAQMKNSYPFLHDYRGKLKLVAMAVQEPTLEYINPDTGKPFSKEEFLKFARDFLGVDVIFWAYIAPWLQAPPPGP